MSSLSFHGAAGTVTGSRHLLRIGGKNILVDCGLFQGPKNLRLKNWDPFPISPIDIDLIVLTHAHIDHTGYLPRLIRQGYSNPIICTHTTAQLCKYLLPDTAHLQEEEARWANKKGYSKHSPALPLFTAEDAENTLKLFKPVQFGDHFNIAPGYRLKFRPTGHILGAAYLDIKTTDNGHPRKIVFSGDLGRPRDEILREPSQAYNVDYLVLESTYGDRRHSAEQPRAELVRVIRQTVERGGALIIPAFSVGRTQTLLYILRELEEEKLIPALPVFVDSPMAIGATDVFRNNTRDLNLECRTEFLSGKNLFSPTNLRYAQTVDESMAINRQTDPCIIISASGMLAGGRVLHHLKNRLGDKQNTLLFIGYQAEGTRGRQILDGAQKIKIFGKEIPVKAHIERIEGFSGHADYQEILAWLMGFNQAPKHIFLVHGEPDAAGALADRIRERFGWTVSIPSEGQKFELEL